MRLLVGASCAVRSRLKHTERCDARRQGIIVRWFKLSIGLAVTVGFFWLLLRELDMAALGDAIAAMSLAFLPAALVVLFVGWMLRVIRWWWMLRQLEPSVRLSACFVPFISAMAVNNVAPFRAGDVWRVVGFQRQLQSPALRVAGTVVVERLLDLTVLLSLFFWGLLALPEGTFSRHFVLGATVLFGVLAAVTLGLFLFLPLLGRLHVRLSTHRFLSSRRWWRVASKHIAYLIEAIGIVRSLRTFLVLAVLSVVSWGCEGAVFMMVAAALDVEAGAFAAWFSMAAGTLATTIPSTPGFMGTFDYFSAQGMEAYGAPAEVAAAFALVIHAVLWAPGTIIGVIGLLLSRRTATPSASLPNTAPPQ